MVSSFCKITLFPEPPETKCQQKKANHKDNPIKGFASITYIYRCEWIVGDMDDDARDDAFRAPIKPAGNDSERQGTNKICP